MASRLVFAPMAIAIIVVLGCGDDGSGTSTATGTASDSTQTSNASETTVTPTSTSATTTSSSGTGSETTASSEESTTAGGGQPDMGMWAHCTGPEGPCWEDAPVCVFLEDDGFCTIYGCEDPAADCAAAPADSNSVPICVDTGSNVYCALSCEGDDMGCPAGMICELIQYGMGPTYEVCF